MAVLFLDRKQAFSVKLEHNSFSLRDGEPLLSVKVEVWEPSEKRLYYIDIIPAPHNSVVIAEARRARDLGLDVTIPDPQWGTEIVSEEDLAEAAEEIWDSRWFSDETGRLHYSLSDEDSESYAESGIRLGKNFHTVSALIRNDNRQVVRREYKLPGCPQRSFGWPVEAGSPDFIWVMDAVPVLVRDLCDELAATASKFYDRVFAERRDRERAELANKLFNRQPGQ